MKGIITKRRVILGIVFLLTAFRIWLAVKTPLYIQADAAYDDMLFVRYAMELLKGNWLGDYCSLTLAKTVSYPLILAFNYTFGIPYSLGMICAYVVSCILFVHAINQFIHNNYFAIAGYLFLLFSPVMFHEENIQKVYRGGYIVIFSMLVLSAIIGMFAEAKNVQGKKIYGWSALGIFALPIFWYLKEDSIWLLPFILVGMCITMVVIIRLHCEKKAKLKRIVAVVLPIIVLGCISGLYKQVNNHYYGIAAVTDRSGTNFEKVISDLIQIEDPSTDTVWITRNMLEQAEENSPTLMSIKPQIDERMQLWVGDGEIDGDIFIWVFREAVDSAGIYDRGSEGVEQFYGDIHQELQEAYAQGRLQSNANDRIYVSSVSRGYTIQEFAEYFSGRIKEVARTFVCYEQNVTSINAARGSYDDIAIMARLTNSEFIWQNTSNDLDVYAAKIVALDQHIVKLYQVTGKLFFYLGMLGIFVLFAKICVKCKQKKFEASDLELLIVVVGLALTILVLTVAVMWFCNFLSIRKVYDYMCGAVPIMNIIEVIGIYQIVLLLVEWTKKFRERSNNKVSNKQLED